jgi:hypothetical protein
MDLNVNSSSIGAGNLIADWSEVGFTAGGPSVLAIGGTSVGTVTFQAWSDPGNTNFGKGNFIGSTGPLTPPFSGGSFTGTAAGTVPLATPYSLTMEVIVQHAGAGKTGFDAELDVNPVPCNCTLTFNSPSQITNCAGTTIPDVTASQDCGNGPVAVPVSFAGAVTNGVCPQIITRTNTAIDTCGTVHTFVQTITINCNPDCTITTSSTNAIAGSTGNTAWVADAGPNAIYYWTANNATITAGQGTTNITWTAGADATKQAGICVRVTTAAGCVSQCCTYVPLTPPCICTLKFNSPTSITNCADDTVADVTASQNCGAGWVSVPVTLVSNVTNGVCPQIVTRKYTATDNCGTTYPFTQTITINCKPDCTITPSVTATVVGATNTASVANAGPGAIYLWNVLNGTIISGQGTPNLTWKAGTDTNSPVTILITITAATGCQSSCSASVKVNPPPKVFGVGDAATMGFWQNKNGQGLICNAPSGPPTLANWLATTFPCLYGSSSVNNLTGKSNKDVANLFLTLFNGVSPKTDAQVMSVALACYFTDTTLGGGTGPVKFGFNQSVGGTGAKLFNVGSFGTALGLQNNTSYPILQIVQSANALKCSNPSQPLPKTIVDLFNSINQTGDIK